MENSSLLTPHRRAPAQITRVAQLPAPLPLAVSIFWACVPVSMMTGPQEAVTTSLLPPCEHLGLSSLSLQIDEPPPICARFGVECTPSWPYKSQSPGRIHILHLRCLLRDFGSHRESKHAAITIDTACCFTTIRDPLPSPASR